MITLAAPTFDLAGWVRLQPLASSDLGTVTRRVNRVATLDGGVAVNDFGSAVGDRTLALSWRVSGGEALIERLVREYARLTVCMRDGVYLAAPESYRRGPRESRMTLLLIERLTTTN